MGLFDLPSTTLVNRVIPKNTFDKYTNGKQRKSFTDFIVRITWLHKLSTGTTNLPAKDVTEIQIFLIQLKSKADITGLLDIIDKSIPYQIIFKVCYEDYCYLSASSKHPHPTNENNAVIDWTFKSPWMATPENPYQIHLRKDLDWVFHDFCAQLSGHAQASSLSHDELVKLSERIADLEYGISRLKSRIKNTQQFNRKVELNLALKKLEEELKGLNLG